ncbi:hypothetical protein EMIT0P291_320013 [Pseudomonas sp. IT-P291]
MAAVTDTLKLFLCGDIMTARGIDAVLPHPGDPRLYEAYVKNAGDYVRLAERVNGSIPRPVDFTYVWGVALDEFELRQPHARIINLETAVSRHGRPEPKGINYRMSPENFPLISAAGIDCCVLANNHVLDWGQPAWPIRWKPWRAMVCAAPAPGTTGNLPKHRPCCCCLAGGACWCLASAHPTAA